MNCSTATAAQSVPVISVIIPSHNCEPFIEECLDSIKNQIQTDELGFHTEISICDDCSTDGSVETIENWRDRNISEANLNISLKLAKSSDKSRGAGFARNQSIAQATGEYLCFCDADDILLPNRISMQLKVAQAKHNALIGSKFVRQPVESTETLTKWINNLTPDQLHTQIYLSFGPTITMTTWFCHRSVSDKVGSFSEEGTRFPEDLTFIYKHLDVGGTIERLDDVLMIYRYHPGSTTFTIPQATIFNLRLERIQNKCLSHWENFTIWNAGKMGRKFYRSLNPENQNKVKQFCDVDPKKLDQKFYHPFPLETKIPIVHFKDAHPPFVICVKTEFTLDKDSQFLENLNSKCLVEGVDYFYFN